MLIGQEDALVITRCLGMVLKISAGEFYDYGKWKSINQAPLITGPIFSLLKCTLKPALDHTKRTTRENSASEVKTLLLSKQTVTVSSYFRGQNKVH